MNLRTIVHSAVEAFFHVPENTSRELATVQLDEATYRVLKVNHEGDVFICVVNPWGDGWRLPHDTAVNDIPLYTVGRLLDARGETISDDAQRSFVETLTEIGEPFQVRDPEPP